MAAEPQTIENWEPREDLGLLVEEVDALMQREGYIMHRILPAMPRSKFSGKVPKIPKEEAMKRYDCRHSAGANYLRVTMKFADDDYETEEFGVEMPVDDRTKARFDDFLDVEAALNDLGRYIILTQWEDEGIQALTDASNAEFPFGGRTTALSTPWSDHANSTPIDDIDVNRRKIRKQFARDASVLCVDSDQLLDLARSQQVIDTSKGQSYQDVRGKAIANIAPIAAALNLDDIYVQTSSELNPAGADNYKRMWPYDKALLMAPNEDRNGIVKGLGRQVVWDREGAVEGDRVALVTDTAYYEDQTRTDVMRHRGDMHRKFFHADAGHLLTNVGSES